MVHGVIQYESKFAVIAAAKAVGNEDGWCDRDAKRLLFRQKTQARPADRFPPGCLSGHEIEMGRGQNFVKR